jgi:hypothetical protein
MQDENSFFELWQIFFEIIASWMIIPDAQISDNGSLLILMYLRTASHKMILQNVAGLSECLSVSRCGAECRITKSYPCCCQGQTHDWAVELVPLWASVRRRMAETQLAVC